MSLNGLDNAAVIEAYEAAVGEPGGWFLLKYVSRDEVDLLGRGSSGVVEIRGAISQYADASPLYGFIRYRRRSILIKYVPEGMSRLVQGNMPAAFSLNIFGLLDSTLACLAMFTNAPSTARVTVHFQAITERFSPHDTVFPISLPKELNDTSLSSACSLHTATGSTSSSNSSLRRRRLVEITEDAEEGLPAQPQDVSPIKAPSVEERPQTSAGPGPVVKEDGKPIGAIDPGERDAPDVVAIPSIPPKSAKRSRLESPLSSSHGHNISLTTADPAHGPHARLNEDHRTSIGSAGPSRRDPYSTYSYISKPKVKLGPRPSLDACGRPYTSGSAARQNEPRPVSTLPAGIRIPRKNSTRPRSQYSIPIPEVAPPLPTNTSASLSPISPPVRPTTSPGISPTKSFLSVAPKIPPKASAMTPEKQKLMKALQLRKKQMSTSQQDPVATNSTSEVAETDQSRANSQLDAIDRCTPIGDVPTLTTNGITSELEGSPESVSVGSASTRGSMDELSESTKVSSISKDTQPSEIKATFNLVEKLASELLDSADSVPASSTPVPMGVGLPSADSRFRLDTRVHGIEAHEKRELSSLALLKPEAVPLPPVEACEIADLGGDTFYGGDGAHAQEPGATMEYADDSALEDVNSDQSHEVNKKIFRQGLIEPIRPDQDVDHSEDCFLSDDSFMDELNTATVQEAKPVSVTKSPVTKSPITPIFPSAAPALPSPTPGDHMGRGGQSPATSRTVSNPIRSQKSSPKPLISATEIPVIETARSVSASFLSSVRSRHAPTVSAKKVNVSSGISQRIKALELRTGKLSTPPSPPVSTAPTPGSPGLPATRKPSVRLSTLASGSKANVPTGPRGTVTTPSPSPSPEPLTIRTQVLPSLRRDDATKKPPQDMQKSRPESISVIARIIRDDTSSGSDLKEGSPLELHQSPLIIEHQRGSSTPSSEGPKSSTLERTPSVLSSSPPSPPNPSSPDLSRPASVVSKMSTSSRGRSENRSSQQRRGSSASGSTTKEDKRESKKSRLLRRMSSLSSSSRKSFAHAISPTLKEEPTFEPEPVPEEVKPSSLLEGWVNVQLPDTLLWRRRCLKLDSQGNIFLSQSQTNESSQPVRQYHLSNFKAVVVPDRDMEELPYSVILELCDGGSLQCACQNAAEQAQVLKSKAYPSRLSLLNTTSRR
ncbi:MAG: hypothetical protein M1840_005018 [Geoglossum simile]|nr:MAG: hypothetical protein M1840_005018 [Geoglossum simile]